MNPLRIIKQVFNRDLESINQDPKTWSLRLAYRRSFVGQINYKKREIMIGIDMIRVANIAQLIDTLKHEIAHAAAPFAKHGKAWKAAAVKLGANPKASLIGPLNRGFVMSCGSCGKELLHTDVDFLPVVFSVCCNEKLVAKPNSRLKRSDVIRIAMDALAQNPTNSDLQQDLQEALALPEGK